jgi:hypothetical protein
MPVYDPTTPDIDFDATPLCVGRQQEDGTYAVLSFVECHKVQWFEGAPPPAAQFKYLFDTSDPSSPYATGFEQVWPLTASGNYVVQQDDLLGVFAGNPDGSWSTLFEGFAQVPQVDLHGTAQAATFVAVGGPVRCSDQPVGGAYCRDASYPATGNEFNTDLTSRFNPDRNGNCTLSGYDVNQGSTSTSQPPYPLFIDWRSSQANRRLWTLGGFVRYLLAHYNNQTWVNNPDFSTLDGLLQDWAPNGVWYDPTDPSTWTGQDIIIRDVVGDGRLWPELLEEVLRTHGFAFRWTLTGDGPDIADIEPIWGLELYRLDSGIHAAPKVVTLPAAADLAVVGQSFASLGGLSLARDHNAVHNAIWIDTDPVLYEVDLLLVPLFAFTAADYGDSAAHTWDRAALDTSDQTILAKYRWWGVDELGEGHTDYESNTFVTSPAYAFDFNPILGSPVNRVPQWVPRRRPGRNTLLTLDNHKKPLEATLWICINWTPPAGGVPGPWDGSSGAWQQVSDGCWRLLKDRLGVELLCDTPLEWKVGKGAVVPSGVVDLIAALNAQSPEANPEFILSLSVVIEGDKGLEVILPKQQSAPGQYTIVRRLDARDHFGKGVVKGNTTYSHGTADVVIRDDTPAATSYAGAVQSAHQYPRIAGTVHVPWLTRAYQIGDRIKQISGRNASLRTNAGDAGEAPYYPQIVAAAWELGGKQHTTMQLADRRAEPQGITKSAVLDAL